MLCLWGKAGISYMSNYLSICAVIKNEGPYLEEWIEFHRIQGVEHFYLYDNGSADQTKDILE